MLPPLRTARMHQCLPGVLAAASQQWMELKLELPMPALQQGSQTDQKDS